MVDSLVAGGEDHDSAFHRAGLLAVLVNAGVLDEVVDGASQSRERAARPSVPAELLVVAPAVLADDRPVVGGIFHSPDDSAEPGA